MMIVLSLRYEELDAVSTIKDLNLITALPENNENRTKCRHQLHRSIIKDIYLVWS